MAGLNILDWLKGKIDKTSITTSLVETVVGKVPDATVVKTLDDKISILSTNRGYLNTPRITDDANNYYRNGKYFIAGSALNCPITQSGYLDVIAHDTVPQLYCSQRYSNAVGSYTMYERWLIDGVWSTWKQLVTTDKIAEITNLGTNVNLNTHELNGRFSCESTTGHPPQHNGAFAFLEVMRLDGNWQKQVLTSFFTGKQYFRFKSGGGYTLPWSELATTDKIDISLLNGWVNFVGNDDISKAEKIGSTVTLSITAKDGTLASGTIIGNIPSQFRPSIRQMFFADAMTNVGGHLGRVFMTLTSNGNLTTGSACPVGTTFLLVKVSYVL